ncbi:hypothetical protein MAR_031671 [Mya arenaria]|uniref:Uncharacterized protein n=1 Tax=Mya arenaria TaxID=6604 RepID=A0ABY7F4H6_MYAAR|nr:hypothetical protein MAR_031671 [Mya arenaria]
MVAQDLCTEICVKTIALSTVSKVGQERVVTALVSIFFGCVDGYKGGDCTGNSYLLKYASFILVFFYGDVRVFQMSLYLSSYSKS